MATKSPGLERIERLKKQSQYILPPEEAEHYGFLLRRMETAKERRNLPSRYFDGLDYVTDYLTNENAKNTYLRPKLNDAEVRVNTPTTEKKIEAVYNELLAMNLQHEVRAFDRDDLEIQELGEDMSDIITRTNQIENDDDFWQEAVMELLTQRAAFIEETFQNYSIRNNSEQVFRSEKRLLSGLKVFLGDISIPAYKLDDQPYILKYDRVHYLVAERKFLNNPRFKHVRPGCPKENEYIGEAFGYRFGDLDDSEVEIITYYSLTDNEFQEFVNGVPMHKIGTPIPGSFPGYPIRMFTLKSLSPHFAYGRPFTAQAKTLQALSNESIRLLIWKFQQSLMPPLGVPKGKVYSRDVWNPGAIAQGLRKDDFERLIDHNGPNESEFRMMDKIDMMVEEFIGMSKLGQGLPTSKEFSATEVLTLQKQAIKMLGLSVVAYTRMKRDLSKLRIYSVADNYLVPARQTMDKIANKLQNIYQSFTLRDTSLSPTQRGTKVIKFAENDLQPEEQEQLFQFEESQAKLGNNIRVKSINAKKLKEMLVSWYVTVVPKEKEGSAFDKVMFTDQLKQAVAVSNVTQTPLAPAPIIETFESKWRAKDWFQKKPPQAPMNPEMQPSSQNPNQPQDPNVQADVTAEAERMMGEIEGLEDTTGAQVSRGLLGAAIPQAVINS